MLYHSVQSSIMGLSLRKYLKIGISHLLWLGMVLDVLLKAWVTWNIMQQTAEGAKILHWDGSFQDEGSGAESKWKLVHRKLWTNFSLQNQRTTNCSELERIHKDLLRHDDLKHYHYLTPKADFFMEVVTGFTFFLPLKDYDKAQHQRLNNIIMKLYACGCFSDVLWHFCVFLSPYTLNT